MTELSLNILDIAQNSIRARASRIEISIQESVEADRLGIMIRDNGCGMTEELLSTVDDPFTTTRESRRFGLGLPLLKYHAELTGGNIEIVSGKGLGTEVRATFGLSHVDRQPLGDIAGVMIILISANPDIDFYYLHSTDAGSYSFSTDELKQALEIDKISDFDLLKDIKDLINENLSVICVSG